MELILESPYGVSIKVRYPNSRQQARFVTAIATDDRSEFLMEIAEFLALNCTDTDYCNPEVAKKYNVDLLETQSTTDMAVDALVNRYSFGMIALWGENLLDKLGLTDKGLDQKVNREKKISAPVEPSQ